MEAGQVIRVRAYGEEVLVRRIVSVKGDVVNICKEEYNKAQTERREPVSVGFNIKYVVEED